MPLLTYALSVPVVAVLAFTILAAVAIVVVVAKRVTLVPLATMLPPDASLAPAANNGLVPSLVLAIAKLANPLKLVGAVGLVAIKI